ELEVQASGLRSFSDRRKVTSGSTDLRFVLTPWEDPASAPGPARPRSVAAAAQALPRADGGGEVVLRYTVDPVGPPISARRQWLLLMDEAPPEWNLARFVSKKPLFLTSRLGKGPHPLFNFALDETVRGGGYDRLYVDGAHSGDLTAEPPVLLSRWRDKKG